MALNQVPVAEMIGEERGGLKHDGRCSVHEWSPHNVCVSRNPSNISHACVYIVIMNVKDVAMSSASVDEISSSCVNYALRLSRRTRCVEGE